MGPKLSYSPKDETQTMDASFQITNPGERSGPVPQTWTLELKLEMLLCVCLCSVPSAMYMSSIMGSILFYQSMCLVSCQYHPVLATIVSGLVIWKTETKNPAMSTTSLVIHVT